VLSRREQQIWDDVQRFWSVEVEEPPRAASSAPIRRKRVSRDAAVLLATALAGAWIAILLLLVGAVLPGLAVGVATALGWALWHSWALKRKSASKTVPSTDRITRGPADEPGHRRLPRTEDAD
jgi:Na+(H+)/acetate symporter ActP